MNLFLFFLHTGWFAIGAQGGVTLYPGYGNGKPLNWGVLFRQNLRPGFDWQFQYAYSSLPVYETSAKAHSFAIAGKQFSKSYKNLITGYLGLKFAYQNWNFRSEYKDPFTGSLTLVSETYHVLGGSIVGGPEVRLGRRFRLEGGLEPIWYFLMGLDKASAGTNFFITLYFGFVGAEEQEED